MSKLELLMIAVPALPLAACLLTVLLGKWLLKSQSHWPVIVGIAGALVSACLLLGEVCHLEPAADGVGIEHVLNLWSWADVTKASDVTMTPSGSNVSDFHVDVVLRADPLTSIMLCMVTFVALLVAIYSMGYMHDDPGYWRFYTYIGLFVFSMTMLVSVSNFVLLYVFWEAVGVCSYFLIGFWFQKPEAAAAGKKAFLVNRVGDFGFALGVFLLWTTYGTLNFHDSGAISGILGQSRLAMEHGYVSGTIGLLIALGLFVGACGKSAQFPLHVWLPDAMEGPTPVSALIHAATMVTAGVYLVARCTPLFEAAPTAQTVVAVIGGFTALMAGVIAMTQTDLKRVLAYSTVSQLGYMFLALGTGSLAGIVAGMFHLFTHAFFKALLFLGAGSVMHAMHHVIDMRHFSGLRRIMPWTHITFWFGCLALAGIVPFAGFWSKDAVLAAVHDASHHGNSLFTVLYWSAVLTAFLTAFYTFRALFMTFFGETRVPPEAHHAHESPPTMVVPLVILAICSLVVGAYFEYTHGFADFLVRTPSLAYERVYGAGLSHEFHMDVAALSLTVALIGIALAAYFYLGERRQIDRLTKLMKSNYGLRLYQLSNHKFYFDEIYAALLVMPLRLLGALSYLVDRRLVDGLVNLVGRVPVWIGAALRPLQPGLVQFYALAMVLGVLVLVGALLIWPVV